MRPFSPGQQNRLDALAELPGPRSGWRSLFFNHADAWGLTLIIASLCLVLHGQYHLAHLPLIAALAAVAWLAFAYNDYCDAPFDALEPAKAARNFFWDMSRGERRGGAILGWMGVAVALGVAAVLMPYGLPGMGALTLMGTAIWAYSAPPLRLKRRPLLDLATHAVFIQTAPYLTVLALLGLPWQPFDYALIGLLALSSLGAQLEQQVRDYHVDAATEGNFTTWVGQNRAARLLRLTTAAFAGTASYHALIGTFPAYLAPFAVIGLPLVAHRFLRRADAPRSDRLAMLALFGALLYGGALCGYMLTR